MSDIDELSLRDATKVKLPSISQVLSDAAFEMANELIDTGLPNQEACSTVACMFIRTAWVVAATGRFSDGLDPRPEKFREAVEQILANVTFRPLAEVASEVEDPHV